MTLVLKILNLVLREMTWEDHTFLSILKATLALFILTLISSSELRVDIPHFNWSVVGAVDLHNLGLTHIRMQA